MSGWIAELRQRTGKATAARAATAAVCTDAGARRKRRPPRRLGAAIAGHGRSMIMHSQSRCRPRSCTSTLLMAAAVGAAARRISRTPARCAAGRNAKQPRPDELEPAVNTSAARAAPCAAALRCAAAPAPSRAGTRTGRRQRRRRRRAAAAVRSTVSSSTPPRSPATASCPKCCISFPGSAPTSAISLGKPVNSLLDEVLTACGS